MTAGTSNRMVVRDRRILTLMTTAGFVQSFGGSILVVTLAFWRPALDLTKGEASAVLGVIRLGTFTAVAFALWGDRLGRRKPFLAAYVTLLAANLATAVFPDIGVLWFTTFQALARAASGAVAALAIVYLAEELTPRIRSFGMGIWGVAGSLAGGLAFLAAPGFEEPAARWRWLFGLSALGIIAYPLLARFLRESRAFRRHADHAPLLASARGASRRPFIVLAATSMLVGGFAAPTLSFAFDYLVNDLDWKTTSASFAIVGAGAVGATGLLIGGRLADMWGRRPTLVLGSLLGAGGGMLFYWTSTPLLLAWIAIGSFGSSAYAPAFTAFRSELFPTESRTTAGALLSAFSVVGAVAGLAVGNLTIDTWGLEWTVTVLGAAALGVIPLILSLPETKGLDLTPAAAPPPVGATPPESPTVQP